LIPVSDDCSSVGRLAFIYSSLYCFLGGFVGIFNAARVEFSFADTNCKAPDDVPLELVGCQLTNLIRPVS
jgi:hypothetical protein